MSHSLLTRRAALRQTLAGAAVIIGGPMTLNAAQTGTASSSAPRTIHVVAQRFLFRPNEIALKAGERVVLEIESLDFVHGFHVPALDIRSDLMPGRITKVELMMPKAGQYEFQCDNFCGDGHENMHGRFIVT